MMNTRQKKIIVVEDEYITAADIIASLESLGFIVPASTDTGEEVLNLARIHRPDLILIDINLKGEMNGITAADIVKKELDIPVIFLTGQSDEATIHEAIISEPFGYILKPFEERSLNTAIAMALYKHSIDQKLKQSELRYRRIADNTDNLVAILNEDFSIDFLNRAGLSFLQDKTRTDIPRNLKDLILPKEIDTLSTIIQSVSDPPSTWRGQRSIHISDREIWFDMSITPITIDDKRIQILWIGRNITDMVRIQKSLEAEGIVQIEKNMERFQILNDEIRNPLTIISTLVSFEDGPSASAIMEQVNKIDDLVTQLDKGWIESNKVRSFLIRHYHHGKDFTDQ